MIVCNWNYSISWCQNNKFNKDSINTAFYGGCNNNSNKSDTIKVALSAIKKANIKLTEAKYNKELLISYKDMLETTNKQVVLLQSAFDKQKEYNKIIIKENSLLIDENNKLKRKNKILISTTIGSTCIALLIILIK